MSRPWGSRYWRRRSRATCRRDARRRSIPSRPSRRSSRESAVETRSRRSSVPNWTTEIEARLAGLRLSAGREAEIIEELSEHLELRYAELRDQGVDEVEALKL